MSQKKYYLVYQIENKSNGMIYIGCHVTENVNDKYMGSGTNIRKAIMKHGMENFEKSILYCFETEQEMLDKEAELVNREFIARQDTYNIIIGGSNFLTIDTVPVRDQNGVFMRVHKTDPRYLSGELVHNWSGLQHSEDTKQKISNKSKIHQAGERNAMYGKHHSEETKRKQSEKNSIKFYVYDLDGNFISEESNVKQYAIDHNMNHSSIIKVMKGNYTHSGGLKFSYTKIN